MRRLALIATVSSAIAGPAFAQDTGFYVGGELGAVIASETDQTYTPAVGAGTTGNVSTDHELGLTGSAFGGYDFGFFRLEAEAGYLSADIDELTSSFASPPILTGGSENAAGEVAASAFMVNALFDVTSFSDYTVFVGAGAGVAELEIAGMRRDAIPAIVVDSKADDRKSAWQVIVGVRKPITANINLHARYRYFNMDEAEMVGYGGRAVVADFSSHTLTTGVSFNF